jgi:hypothetical protein
MAGHGTLGQIGRANIVNSSNYDECEQANTTSWRH